MLIKSQVHVWKCVLKLYGLMTLLGHVSVTVTLSILSIRFSTETTTIKNVSHYALLILTNMPMIPLETVSENAPLDTILTLQSDLENVSLHVRPTIFTRTTLQIDALPHVPLTHSCMQTQQLANAYTNAKMQTDLPITKLRHAFLNVLQPGSFGVNVSSTLACSSAQMDTLLMCYQTVNVTNNAQLQDLRISGLPPVSCTVVM